MGRPFEIIIIDDGSTDGSFDLLKEIHQEDSRLRVIRLRRNFGQTSAFAAGFDSARAEWIVTMDADSQNDPADIPEMIAIAEQGYDVVSGWRRKRQDALFTRKIPSFCANWLISRVTGVRLHDNGCALKVYHRYVAKNVKLYGELHRFIPAAASGLGIRVAELPVNHRAREVGKSKYAGLTNTATRTVKVFLDLLTLKFLLSFATRPIHIFGSLGLLSLTGGFSLAIYLSILKIFFGESIGDRPLLVLAVMLMTVGVQFITMGLVADLMVRTYHESQDRPIYMVREYLDSGQTEDPDRPA
jgi:glycosyltransferase involved in cell wall biosynthesis